VIVSTVTHLTQTPSVAATIASELGTTGAAAFDISAACAGFCYGTAMADSLIRSGSSKYVLVIGVERLSDITDIHDRSTAFIFADGAGAAVVGPSDTPGIGPVVWGSDGDQAELIKQSEMWDEAVQGEDRRLPVLQMKGNPVFKWASFTMAKAAAEAMDAAGVRPEDLEVFVPHQANMRITDAMFRALKLPPEVVVARDIATQGNTSAASIPLAMESLLTSGQARSGQVALIIGFGAGLVYAGQVVVLP
jgi:3-oxoacyl-[acyl-carrier-protein] synthase-3